MGLTKDIENTFLDTMGYDDMTDEVAKQAIKQKAKKLGINLASAIIKWIQKQEFNITDMKAIVQLEKLQTTGDLSAHVKNQLKAQLPMSTVMSPAGIPNPVALPITMNSLTLRDSVRIPKLRLASKGGGSGGSMNAVGYAYVGDNNPISPNESNENKTKVKLLKVRDK